MKGILESCYAERLIKSSYIYTSTKQNNLGGGTGMAIRRTKTEEAGKFSRP
jgi:hypothetical protein